MAAKKTKTAAPAKDAWAELMERREAYLKKHKDYVILRESIVRSQEALANEFAEFSKKMATFKRGDRAEMIIRGVWQEVAVDSIHSPSCGYFLEDKAYVKQKDLEPRYTVYQIQKNGQPDQNRLTAVQSELVPLS